MRWSLLVLGLVVIGLWGVVGVSVGHGQSSVPPDAPPALRQFDTDYSQHNIDLSTLKSGGPPKDGIPAGPDGGVALPFRALDAGEPARVVTVTAGGTQATVFWSRAAESAMAFETSAAVSVQNGTIVDKETGSTWSVEGVAIDGPREGDRLEPLDEAYVAFWFAWAAFQPETALWTN